MFQPIALLLMVTPNMITATIAKIHAAISGNSDRWCHQVCVCLYLRWKVVEAKHKSPVEISFSGQRAEVDVSLLFVSVQPLYPSAHREQNQDQDVNKLHLIFTGL